MGVTRTFSRGIDDCQVLHEALSSYAERAAEKLRKDGLRAGVMDVYAMSNRFHKANFYYNKTTFRFPVPTSDSPEIIKDKGVKPTHLTFLISKQLFYI
ncbi:hypothetical protein [Desulfoluna butyratoxydans]|uniref:DinB/UmuC family translesion DNA polymerase n=1 Tax=Desulfoluna butyratoxydans TaxID=231438 RepID=UPI0015D315BE